MNTMRFQCHLALWSNVNFSLLAAAILLLHFSARSEENKTSIPSRLRWLSITNSALALHGLPWFQANAPELWRLPKTSKDKIPARVWARAVAPDGGRIRLCTDTSRLALRVERAGKESKRCFIDVYLDDDYAGSSAVTGTNLAELVLFENMKRALRQVTIYLPNNHEVRVESIGLDTEARLEPSRPFAAKNPIVCYGSSVLQGTGAAHPSKTYPAVLARTLNFDFVNLGFGGAGKAEPEVVALVNQLDACCFIFDLGKSYGDQDIGPYDRMLGAIRARHPKVPIVCITPIYSTKENDSADYHRKSENLRALMRRAAEERRQKGDKFMFVVEGLDLFNAADKALFQDPLHPNDEGNERMARRLASFLEKFSIAGP